MKNKVMSESDVLKKNLNAHFDEANGWNTGVNRTEDRGNYCFKHFECKCNIYTCIISLKASQNYSLDFN